MTTTTIQNIQIDKANLSHTNIVESQLDVDSLEDGKVLLKVESFGFSANNITYGILGDKMGYWGFFSSQSEWGILPVWGFATVQASKHPEVKVSEKVYGYLPMASHIVIKADKVTPQGFFDVSETRKSISPVYDHYVRCANDPGYNPATESWQLNYRPLFMTSFVLDDYIGEQMSDSVNTVVLTSASSKTAYGAAFLLKQNREKRQKSYKVIGLTSKSNLQFVRDTYCYDEVVSYDDAKSLTFSGENWVLDFAGNKSLLLQLQHNMDPQQDNLVFIGATDVEAQSDKPDGELNGELFFAPAQVKKRTNEWGSSGFLQQYAGAWLAFSKHIEHLITTQHHEGTVAIQALYLQGLAGNFNTREMNVARF